MSALSKVKVRSGGRLRLGPARQHLKDRAQQFILARLAVAVNVGADFEKVDSKFHISLRAFLKSRV